MSMLPATRLPSKDPFLDQVLVGWAPWDRRLRFPVTFSVEKETDRVMALRASPMGLSSLLGALPRRQKDCYAVLSGGGESLSGCLRLPDGQALCSGKDVHRLSAPLEIVHLGQLDLGVARNLRLPETVLLHPDRVLPPGSTSGFALSIQDGCHGLLLCTEKKILRNCLRVFLEACQRSVLGGEGRIPPISDALLEPLLVSTPPGVFRELRFLRGQHFWRMEFQRVVAGYGGPLDETLQWVCEGSEGRWRAGWHW
jgi:hypothetical protein